MPVFNPLLDPSALQARMASNDGLTVVCYCAAWCDTCTQYEADFAALAAQLPQHAFVWIDIEDSPELLGDEDIENFPTVSIQNTGGHIFFGTLLPYIDHLERLIRHSGEPDTPPIASGGPPLLGPLLAAAAQQDTD